MSQQSDSADIITTKKPEINKITANENNKLMVR